MLKESDFEEFSFDVIASIDFDDIRDKNINIALDKDEIRLISKDNLTPEEIKTKAKSLIIDHLILMSDI